VAGLRAALRTLLSTSGITQAPACAAAAYATNACRDILVLVILPAAHSRRIILRRSFRIVRAAAAALALTIAAMPVAAQPPTLPDAYRGFLEAGVANGALAGVAVGLVENDAVATSFYGKDGARPDAASQFEIGAVTDVLTGTWFARDVLERKLRLDDTLGAHLAEAHASPQAAFATVTLLDLASQQSGIPPTPPNLFPANGDDPFADYRQADLLRFLAHGTGRVSPGTYSIVNAGLLGLVLARVDSGDAAALLRDKVLTPLGMTHTGFDDDASLLAGHAFGAAAAHWHFDVLAPAAGLRATLDDLVALVRANLRPEASPLRAALLLARQARAPLAHGSAGFGWNIEEIAAAEQTWPLVWRASVTGGFAAFVGFRTDRQLGLVLLASSAVDLAPLGLSFLTDRAPPPPPASPYRAGIDELQRYPGLYKLLDGRELTIRADNGALSAQLRGSPAWPLFGLSEDVFAGAGGSVTFVRNIDAISGLLLQSDGRFIAADRLSARAPRLPRGEFAVDAGQLTQYAGDFLLDSGLLLRVAPTAGGLAAQFSGTAPFALRAYASDAFVDREGVNRLLFRRDDTRHVVGVTIDLAGGEHDAKRVAWNWPPRAAASDVPAATTEDKP
jgi:CubicO group peptidase (beta-lactamase class C family)